MVKFYFPCSSRYKCVNNKSQTKKEQDQQNKKKIKINTSYTIVTDDLFVR